MSLRSTVRSLVAAALAVACYLGGRQYPVAAQSSGIRATVTYTGSLGPVSSARQLCLCVYVDPTLRESIGCFISFANGVSFQITPLSAIDYFLIAFLDPDYNEEAGPGEPLGIYRDRTAPPGDPVTAGPDLPHIDITFGDESLTPTPMPSETPTETPTPTLTPSPTVIPCAGDCDGSGEVTVDELLILVNIALGTAPLPACGGADTDGSGAIEVTEILAAVNNAILGCSE